MRLITPTLEELLRKEEGSNRGWVTGRSTLYPLRVLVDGKEMGAVMAVNRKKGKAEVSYDPPRLDRHEKRILTYMVYGRITLEAFFDESSTC